MKSLQQFLTESVLIFEDMTDAQESATCVIFNEFVKNRKTGDFLDENNENGDPFVNEILNTYYPDKHFTKVWLDSFPKQVNKITSLLENNGLDPSEYYMERFGGSKESTYQFDDNSLWLNYKNLTTAYINLMNVVDEFSQNGYKSSKDNWDPTDVILYKKSLANALSNIFNSLASNIENAIVSNNNDDRSKIIDTVIEKLRSIYLKKYKPFIGLSLKQLKKKDSPSLEYYNAKDDDNIIVHPWKGKPIIAKTNRNISIDVPCTYKFENTIIDSKDIEDPKNIKGNSNIKITLRTFNEGVNGIDISMKGHPSLGKCPKRVWTRYLYQYILDNKTKDGFSVKKVTGNPKNNEYVDFSNISDQDALGKRDIVDLVNLFYDYLTNLNTNRNPELQEAIKTIIQFAAKDIPKCLPFVIIH